MRKPALGLHRWAFGIALLVACVAAVSVAATAASAAEFKVLVCNPDTNGLPNRDASLFAISPGGILADNNCPTELTIDSYSGDDPEVMTSFGDYGGFESPWMGNHVDRMKLEVAGGDTSGAIEYSIVECFGCAPIAELDPVDGPGFVEQTVSLSGINRFYIQGRCVQLICPSVPTLRLRRFEFTVIDNSKPQIVEPMARTTFRPWGDRPLGWVSDSDLLMSAGATDTGSGIAEANIKIDGTEVWHSGYCDLGWGVDTSTSFGPCPNSATMSREHDIANLQNGPHTIEINAVDAVGNRADTYTEVFFVDNSPPAQPEGLFVLDPLGFDGWSQDAQVTVAYENPWSNPLNQTGAPLKYVYYDLQPLDGQQHDPEAQLWSAWGDPVTTQLPEEGRWRMWIWVTDVAGNRSNRAYIDLGLDFDQPIAPELVANGWATMQQLIDGLEQTWVPRGQWNALESGICGYAFKVDDVVGSAPEVALDATADMQSIEIPARIGAGRHFAHIRSVACNGRASDVETVQLNVDGKAPTVTAFPATQPGWRAEPVVVSISGADDLSGVERIEYSIDGAPIETVASGRAFVSMPEGEKTVEFRAFDRAGNASDQGSTTVRTDTTAPTVSFGPRSNLSPALLTAQVKDPGSGIANAWIEISEAGANNWRQFGDSVAPSAPAATFTREIADQLALVGRYSFRVVAVDGAGNRTHGSNGAGAADFELPIKPASAMALGLASVKFRCATQSGRPCRSVAGCPASANCSRTPMIDKSRSTSFRQIRFGEDLALVGALQGTDGSPLVGKTVEIVELPKYGTERVIASVTTDDSGEFEHLLADGPSAYHIARFNGDATNGSQQQTVEVKVRANVTMKLSRKRVKAGQELRFSGRVRGATRFASEAGKAVQLQFYRGGRWFNFGDSPRTDSSGRFKYSYSWPLIPRRTRIYFHAKVAPDGNWPFATGSSESVSVTLIP